MTRKLVSTVHGDFWVPVVKFDEMHAESFRLHLFIHMQVSALIKQNKFLAKKNLKTEDTALNACKKETDDGNDLKSPEEALTGSTAANIQVCPCVSLSILHKLGPECLNQYSLFYYAMIDSYFK